MVLHTLYNFVHRLHAVKIKMVREFKHPKVLRDYWAKIKRQYRARKKAREKEGDTR